MQFARGVYNQKFLDQDKFPTKLNVKAEEAFNLATIQGARAVGMEAQIGSLAEGKLADIVVFHGRSPAMVCATEQNPVAALMLHSSIRDINTVIVDGTIRKQNGRLKPTQVSEGGLTTEMPWSEIAEKLVENRQELQKKIDKLDIEAGRKGVIKLFLIDEKAFAEHV